MTYCSCCGTPTPALERILPLAIQFRPPGTPVLALFRCHGAAKVDQGFLRFGIIARAPWSCGNGRWIPWEKTTEEFRRRAVTAEQLRLNLMGWI